MESKRFEIVASTKELVTADGKNAIRVELQYGKEGQPTELVIAELYNKEGKWAYTRSQVRIDCTHANVSHVLTAAKEMFETSKKVEKKASAKKTDITSAIAAMTDEERAALLKALVDGAKPAAKAPAKAAATDSELALENILTSLNKRQIKK